MLKRYVKNPSKRCSDGGTCTYSGKNLNINTPGCVIGAALPPKVRENIDRGNPDGIAFSVLASSSYYTLPKFMQDNTVLFARLQKLHDNDVNWTKEGLSEEGLSFLNTIITSHELSSEIIGEIIGVAL